MRWYFCINGFGLSRYESLIKAAVVTARERTTLEPHLLYDGPDCEFISALADAGVMIHRAKVEFEIAPAEALSMDVAKGAFLRLLIPEVEKEQRHVLYTDCDVLFRSALDLDGIRPRILAAAPEGRLHDWSYFNSGVMVVCVPALREAMPELLRLARLKDWGEINRRGRYDQGVLNEAFRGEWEKLPPEYNWKPYWPANPDAKIIHYHGVKPKQMQRYLDDGPSAIRIERKRRILGTMDEARIRAAIDELEQAASRF